MMARQGRSPKPRSPANRFASSWKAPERPFNRLAGYHSNCSGTQEWPDPETSNELEAHLGAAYAAASVAAGNRFAGDRETHAIAR